MRNPAARRAFPRHDCGDTLRNSAVTVTDERRLELLRSEGERLLEQARIALSGPDLHEVETRHASFAEAMSGSPMASRNRENQARSRSNIQ